MRGQTAGVPNRLNLPIPGTHGGNGGVFWAARDLFLATYTTTRLTTLRFRFVACYNASVSPSLHDKQCTHTHIHTYTHTHLRSRFQRLTKNIAIHNNSNNNKAQQPVQHH